MEGKTQENKTQNKHTTSQAQHATTQRSESFKKQSKKPLAQRTRSTFPEKAREQHHLPEFPPETGTSRITSEAKTTR